ncbi:hypothetical protein BCR43DRAFT_76517 [Syncephalastrum racemosum]|uniref:Uncharacterized protein n=1 Tax=Syncephalastrum racemosum TaxID=13706 RepID=A0A1X2H2G9_SYNRA|nr:hypothetical protein BCR43DRAFT_76517 [Syncephalastrum racemosum]
MLSICSSQPVLIGSLPLFSFLPLAYIYKKKEPYNALNACVYMWYCQLSGTENEIGVRYKIIG